MPGNQVWARNASLLILTVTKRTFDHNNSPNSCCVHDIGLAACQLVLQATELGYATHQMAGIEGGQDPGGLRCAGGLRPCDRDRRRLSRWTRIPLPDDLREMELGERTRRPFNEYIFTDRWGQPAAIDGFCLDGHARCLREGRLIDPGARDVRLPLQRRRAGHVFQDRRRKRRLPVRGASPAI